MALIISNEKVTDGVFELKAAYSGITSPGQFFMIKAAEQTFLPRPISIHDRSEDTVTFLYQAKGRGTNLLAEKKPGEDLAINKPCGNGFKFFDKDSIFVGGGIGAAPLYYALRQFKALYPHRKASVYLGFSEAAYKTEQFEDAADAVTVDVGGIITDLVSGVGGEAYYACGPEIMMKSLYDRTPDSEIYVSMERRMGCGVGACFSCSIKTAAGMKKVCSDGPVFPAGEVFYE